MTLDESDIQSRVGPQLTRLADTLADVPGVADAPSLCEGWTVRHVLAHMTMAARYDDRDGVMDVEDLETLVPDLADRTTLVCGPPGLLEIGDERTHVWI